MIWDIFFQFNQYGADYNNINNIANQAKIEQFFIPKVIFNLQSPVVNVGEENIFFNFTANKIWLFKCENRQVSNTVIEQQR